MTLQHFHKVEQCTEFVLTELNFNLRLLPFPEQTYNITRVGGRSRFLVLLFCGKGFRASFEALRTKKENFSKMGELLDFL